MSRYDRMAGRKKYPGRRRRRGSGISTFSAGETIKESELVYVASRIDGVVPPAGAGSAQLEKTEGGRKLVYAASRIDGKVTVSISPEILAKTEGMGWHQRIARIHALTSIPFADISKMMGENN